MNTKRERPGLVILFFAIIVIATWASMLMSSLSYNRRIGGQPDIMSHYPATFDELVEAFGDELLLPTWMPDGLELKKIYLLGNKTGALAFLAYSNREINHYLEAKIILTLKRPYSIGLNPEDPNLIKVGDMLVSAADSPMGDIVLFFYHNSTYYLFTASAYRKDTLIKIVENMRAMKG